MSPLRRSLALLGMRGGSLGVVVGFGMVACCDGGCCWGVVLLSVVGAVGEAEDGVPSGKSHLLRSQDISGSSHMKRRDWDFLNVQCRKRKDVFSSGTKKSSDAILPRILSRVV